MKAAVAVAVVAGLAAGAGGARAEEPGDARPEARAEGRREARSEVIATQPLALIGRGVALSYERRIAPRLSAVALGGVRGAAEQDFSSKTVTAGAELRAWLRGQTPMSGPFLALHASAAYTRLSDDAMGYVGSQVALAQRLDVGWRFTIRDRLAIAPAVGLGLREDVDGAGRLATTVRGHLAIGLEVGWMR